MPLKQLFFSKEEKDKAFGAAADHNEELFEIVDKRTKSHSPLMYILTRDAIQRMIDNKMLKRMWVSQQVLWKEERHAEQKED